MANSKRIQIQHWYTTGNAAPSGTGLTNMLLGEIAIATQTGKEAIFIKNNDGSAVTFMTSAQTNDLITQKLGDAGIGGDDVISTLSQNLGTLTQKFDTHIKAPAELNKSGHVMLVSGDVKSETYANGYAAAASHTHGQYLTGVTAGSGLAIAGIIENGDVKLQLDSETDNKINSGVTAYNWGNHAYEGYAKNDDLTAHTDDKIVHITKDERNKWDDTTERLNLFLDESGTTESTLDSIIEFQKWFETHGTSASNMQAAITKNTTDISAISGVVENNANNISLLSTSLNNISGSVSTISQTVSNNETTINNIKLNYVDNIVSGANINVTSAPSGTIKGKTFTISHITPIDDSEATNIDFTNKNSGTTLTWGGRFTTISSLKYDKNGHIINTGASTFTLPTLNTGNTTTFGIVKLYEGELTLVDALNGGENGFAVGKGHSHSQYVTTDSVNTTLNDYIKFSDLGSNTGDVIVISCGTY